MTLCHGDCEDMISCNGVIVTCHDMISFSDMMVSCFDIISCNGMIVALCRYDNLQQYDGDSVTIL